jgi:hypothetical protein
VEELKSLYAWMAAYSTASFSRFTDFLEFCYSFSQEIYLVYSLFTHVSSLCAINEIDLFIKEKVCALLSYKFWEVVKAMNSDKVPGPDG